MMRPADTGDLHRVRAAVVAVLALTVALSLTANVLSAEPSLIGRAVAAWPPLALLICTDLISRVPASRRAVGIARQSAAVGIAGIAAALSYGHMVALARHHGASTPAAHVVPLTVDGLALVAYLCMFEITTRLHTATAPTAPATGGGAVARADRTDRTDRTPNPQVRRGALCQTGRITASDRTDETPPTPARTPSTPAGESLPVRVRALVAEYPGWTQAAVAERAGCSVRTVRRHLAGTHQNTPAQDAPAADVSGEGVSGEGVSGEGVRGVAA